MEVRSRRERRADYSPGGAELPDDTRLLRKRHPLPLPWWGKMPAFLALAGCCAGNVPAPGKPS